MVGNFHNNALQVNKSINRLFDPIKLDWNGPIAEWDFH